MIFGLSAALGWGLADFGGAVAGRRIGSMATVLVAQTLSAVIMTALLFVGGHDAGSLGPYLVLLAMNGVASAGAYVTHYRALELGPVAVVSPIGATYAVVGVILAVVVLGERPGAWALVGGVVTVIGVMLTSTDLARLRQGVHTRPPGLWWAVASAVLFGIGGFLLGYLAQEVGWVTGLWASRIVQLVAFVAIAVWVRERLEGVGRNAGTAMAVGVGLADLLGVVSFSYGAEQGFISLVLIASAVFPLIAVVLSVALLGERPVVNQYVGIGLTVVGMLLLALG